MTNIKIKLGGYIFKNVGWGGKSKLNKWLKILK